MGGARVLLGIGKRHAWMRPISQVFFVCSFNGNSGLGSLGHKRTGCLAILDPFAYFPILDVDLLGRIRLPGAVGHRSAAGPEQQLALYGPVFGCKVGCRGPWPCFPKGPPGRPGPRGPSTRQGVWESGTEQGEKTRTHERAAPRRLLGRTAASRRGPADATLGSRVAAVWRRRRESACVLTHRVQ